MTSDNIADSAPNHDLPPAHAADELNVGLVLFPGLNQLDLTGPYEVFSRLPGARVRLLAEQAGPVRSEFGLTITADTSFADAGKLDVLCVPGGTGVNQQLKNTVLLTFLAEQAAHVHYLTSVCSGALLLGASGLLRGYRATTHWMSLEFLPAFGAHPVDARVVIDRNRITGGGITAGIDFGLTVAAALCGEQVAQEIQLMLEYRPQPPYDCGSPESAGPAVRDAALGHAKRSMDERRLIVERLAATQPAGAPRGGPV